jgi:DNA modification methylase
MSYYTDPLVTLHVGDCLEVLPTLEADSVDAVVTDPPYGLEFMGKEWDGPKLWDARGRQPGNPANKGQTASPHRGSNAPASYRAGPAFQAWCEQWGREALRVTKPGGYLLAFGGTRTHHRLVCALEDAGWIIRDELDWIYASGFPKGKANLKPAHEPIVLARKPGPLRPLGIDECRIGTADGFGGGANGTSGFAAGYEKGDGFAASQVGRWPSNVLLQDAQLFDQPNPYVVGSGATQQSPADYRRSVEADGGVTRWNTEEEGSLVPGYGDSGGYSRFFAIPRRTDGPDIHEGSPSNQGLRGSDGAHKAGDGEGSADSQDSAEEEGLTEPYPRHLIIPKADRAERERGLVGVDGKRGNTHPTVKSLDLMRHLVRLVTPPGGVVLDPFLGSGTTCLAASEEGFRSIGVERELEYLEIAKGRLMATPMGLGLDHGLAGKASPKTHPDLSKHQPKRRAPGENYSGGWAGTDEEPAA